MPAERLVTTESDPLLVATFVWQRYPVGKISAAVVGPRRRIVLYLLGRSGTRRRNYFFLARRRRVALSPPPR
jgi:hypothetical protein